MRKSKACNRHGSLAVPNLTPLTMGLSFPLLQHGAGGGQDAAKLSAHHFRVQLFREPFSEILLVRVLEGEALEALESECWREGRAEGRCGGPRQARG